MKGVKVMLMKHGEKMMMDSTFKLNDAGMVMADGTIKMTDGTTKMLKEGQCIDIDGKMWMMKNKMAEDKM